MIGRLGGAAILLAIAAWASARPVQEQISALVTFKHDAASGEVLCHGVLVGSNVLTAHHCISDMQAQQMPVIIESRLGVRRLSIAQIQTLSATDLAAQTASFPIDFNIFAWRTLGKPEPVPDLKTMYGRAAVGDTVIVDAGAEGRAQCIVKAVCGSFFVYSCSPDTRPGWSGSPVLSADPTHRLVGIHSGAASPAADYAGPKLSQGVNALSIVGRSSALFATDEEFGNLVARSPRFAHKWRGACEALAPPVSAGSPLRVRTIASAPLMIHGMVALDQDNLVGANITNPGMSMCLLTRSDGFKAWQCRPNATPFADRINTIEHGPGQNVAIGEALLPPALRRRSDTPETIAGAVSLATLSIDAAGPRLTLGQRIVSPVGSIYAVRYVHDDIFAGGQDGVCAILAGTSICKRIGTDAWRVNGLLRLQPDLMLAVGTDMQGRQPFPMARWYRREPDGWRQIGQIGPTDALLKIAAGVGNRRTGMQLKAPVEIGGRIFAFGSDGGAYELRLNGRPRPVAIEKLWRSPELGRDRLRLEDAVRDAVKIGPSLLAIASSDGSMHILRYRDGVFVGDQGLTVFDRGIWTTELELAGDTLFVRSQDGNVSVIDLSRVDRH